MRRCSLLFGTLILVGAVTPPLGAQASTSASLGLDGSRLTARTDTLRVRFVRGEDTTDTGIVVDAIRLGTVNGQAAIIRLYQSNDRLLGSRRDSIVDAQSMLRPITHVSVSTRTSEQLAFTANRVTGTVTLPNGSAVAVDSPLDEAMVNGSSFDLALRSAPLATGWSATLPAFIPSTRQSVMLRASVAGTDILRGRTCWKVEGEFVGTPATFWIDQTDRRLCRQVLVPRPGMAIILEPRALPLSKGTRAM